MYARHLAARFLPQPGSDIPDAVIVDSVRSPHRPRLQGIPPRPASPRWSAVSRRVGPTLSPCSALLLSMRLSDAARLEDGSARLLVSPPCGSAALLPTGARLARSRRTNLGARVARAPRRGHDGAAARCRWSPSVARDDARIPCGPPARNKGQRSRRPTQRRGDRRRHAQRRRRPARSALAWPNRRPLAGWSPHPRSPVAR
jgi:hypothetical protein